MNLLKRLFANTKPQIECPRCLGKGHVDLNDIKRFNKELRWLPGSCAYCNSTGKIDPKLEKEVPVDTAYLTIDLGPDERKRILDGDAGAWDRADEFDMQFEDFCDQVNYLHFDAGLNSEQITELYMVNQRNPESYETEKQELMEYINKIISKRTD